MSPIFIILISFLTLMIIWYLQLTKDTKFDPDRNGLHVCYIVVGTLGTLILLLMLLVYPINKKIYTYEIDDIVKGKTYKSIKLKNGNIINDDRVKIFNADSIKVIQNIDVNSFGIEIGLGYIVKVKE